MSNTTTDTPEIYVICLSSYTSGLLYGRWINATDSKIMEEEIQEMLDDSPAENAEEWVIKYHRGFGGLDISERDGLDKIAEFGASIEAHGAAFIAYAENNGVYYATEESFQDAYCGEWSSEQAYAEDLFNELYGRDVTEYISHYIDYKAFAEDIFMCDYYSIEGDSGVHVFRNC